LPFIKFPVASFAANHTPDEAEVGVGGIDPIGGAVAANLLGDPALCRRGRRPAPSSSQAGSSRRTAAAVARPRRLRPKHQTLEQCCDRSGKGLGRGRFGAQGRDCDRARRAAAATLESAGNDLCFNSHTCILLGTDHR
jgi:hypothetical protein